MRAIIDIQIAADIRIALSEHELAVWAHGTTLRAAIDDGLQGPDK